MTFAALDSALLGPLFATDAMRACFSDEARLRAMLAAEAALARAEAAHGLVPDGLAGALDAIPPVRPAGGAVHGDGRGRCTPTGATTIAGAGTSAGPTASSPGSHAEAWTAASACAA